MVVGMNRVRLDPAMRTVSFDVPGIELNLGAIGKGHAVDRLGAVLRRRGVTRALVSAGGSSVLAVGGDERGWTVDLTSPQLDSRIARMRLRDAALGTSGAGEQYVVADGVRHGHVFDPRPAAVSRRPERERRRARWPKPRMRSRRHSWWGAWISLAGTSQRHPHILALITVDDTATTHVVGSCNGARLED
jgi:thiamine biosynthesis lipoprotein